MSPRGDTQRPSAFQRARILCRRRARGRGGLSLLRASVRDKDFAPREGDRLVTKRHSLVLHAGIPIRRVNLVDSLGECERP